MSFWQFLLIQLIHLVSLRVPSDSTLPGMLQLLRSFDLRFSCCCGNWCLQLHKAKAKKVYFLTCKISLCKRLHNGTRFQVLLHFL